MNKTSFSETEIQLEFYKTLTRSNNLVSIFQAVEKFITKITSCDYFVMCRVKVKDGIQTENILEVIGGKRPEKTNEVVFQFKVSKSVFYKFYIGYNSKEDMLRKSKSMVYLTDAKLYIESTIRRLKIHDEKKKEVRDLSYIANYDPLTGLGNRFFLKKYIEKNLSQEGTIAFLDLDGMKEVNDIKGHDAGDLVLERVSELLQKHFRKTDAVIRYGGDEFIAIMPEMSLKESYKRLELLRKDIEETNFVNKEGKELVERSLVTMSIGFSQGLIGHELIMKSDCAMYYSKENGKNKLTAFESLDRKELNKFLKQGIRKIKA